MRFSQAGAQLALAVGLFTFGGLWLDRKLGTGVLFTLLGLAVGFGGGSRALYLDLYGRERGAERRSREPEAESGAAGPEEDGAEPADAQEM